VREELRRVYGKRVSRKKVARLMREHNLNARRRGKFIPTTNSHHGLEVCENLLNRARWREMGIIVPKVRHHLSTYPGRLGVSDGGVGPL
jgi:transposase InsO family protein